MDGSTGSVASIEALTMDSTVYVDQPFRWESQDPQVQRAGRRHGHRWCHMWSEDVEALHAIARKIGMKREWFQNKPGFPHYDLVPTRRAMALKLGAVEKPLMDWLRERQIRRKHAEIASP